MKTCTLRLLALLLALTFLVSATATACTVVPDFNADEGVGDDDQLEEDEEEVTTFETLSTTDPATEPESETEPATVPETVPVTEPVTDSVTEPVTNPVTDPVTDPVTETDTDPETEPDTEPETESQPKTFSERFKTEAQLSELNPLMQPIFKGTTVKNETVMFLDKGDVKTLLYPIESVVSVTSYDGEVTYREGTDYIVVNGQLQVTANSSIPCITRAVYYNDTDSIIQTEYNGQNCPTHWGEGRTMTDWQVNVTYTHTDTWSGYTQSSRQSLYKPLIEKLLAGEDITIIFYGDSITYGSTSSYVTGYAPYQPSYAMLFTQALADLFEYKIRYVNTGLATDTMGVSPVPAASYVGGTRGTITYINTAIGGWTSQDAINYKATFLEDQIRNYGCDLFVVALGMNDGAVDPSVTKNNVQTIVDSVYTLAPNAAVALTSTMVPNPDGIGWYGNQDQQEAQLKALATAYRRSGRICDISCMTSVSLAVLERKDFNDYSGNNINHPNDFFGRLYAQNLVQLILGYDNLG